MFNLLCNILTTPFFETFVMSCRSLVFLFLIITTDEFVNFEVYYFVVLVSILTLYKRFIYCLVV